MKNPVFMREINTMFRSYKTFVSIGIYSLALLGIVTLVLYNFVLDPYNGYNPKNANNMFCVMAFCQTGMIFLAVPGFSAGSISGERERQTLDLMLITKMKPFTIVFGKLLSSLLFIIVMLSASMPVYALVSYFGGISIGNLASIFIFDFSYAMAVGSLSILFSCIFKKNVTATVISYLTLFLGPFIIFILSAALYSNIPNWLLGFLFSINPSTAFISYVDSVLGTNSFSFFFGSATSDRMLGFPVAMWQAAIAVNIIFTFVFLRLSAAAVNPLRINKLKLK